MVPGVTGVAVADASLGGCLAESDQAGVYVDPLNFPEGEETDARTRSETTGAFHQVLSFTAAFFPYMLPSESQPLNIASWFHGFGDNRKKEPRVYLSCFYKIKELMVEIDRKVTATAKDQGRSRSVLPSWGDIYRLRGLPSSHSAAPLNLQFSRLLNKSVPSRYVSLSLEDCAQLEACMRGLAGSQFYASWAMASIFAFLHDSGLSPSDEAFNKVVSSLSVALTAQASYVASAFLKQIRRKTYVAHLPTHTHDSMKHALLLTPSEDSLFSEEVIQRSLGQVRDDSQLQLLRNLSTQRSEKSSASFSSTLAQHRRRSPGPQQSASSSSRDSSYQSRGSRGYKCAASPSPALRRSLKHASKSLAKKELCPSPSLVGGCLGLHWRQWRDRGAEPWVVEVLRRGYRALFVSDPPLSAVPIPLPSYSPLSIKGKALQGEI